MSAQLVLTDLEMEALVKCVDLAARTITAAAQPGALTPEERVAADRAFTKFTKHLNRKSRRRPKA